MLRLMLRLLQIIKKIRLLNNTGINIMFFYANSLIIQKLFVNLQPEKIII